MKRSDRIACRYQSGKKNRELQMKNRQDDINQAFSCFYEIDKMSGCLLSCHVCMFVVSIEIKLTTTTRLVVRVFYYNT